MPRKYTVTAKCRKAYRRRQKKYHLPRICVDCGKESSIHGSYPDGTPRYGPRCNSCQHKRNPKKGTWPSRFYRRFLKELCEHCGFKPIHPDQMDIHHKDRNRKNNDPSNLETLCANCHRLVHALPT